MPAQERWDAWTLGALLAQIVTLPPTSSSKVTELKCPSAGRQTQHVVFVCNTDRCLNCFAKSNYARQRPKRSCWQEKSKYSSCHTLLTFIVLQVESVRYLWYLLSAFSEDKFSQVKFKPVESFICVKVGFVFLTRKSSPKKKKMLINVIYSYSCVWKPVSPEGQNPNGSCYKSEWQGQSLIKTV